MSEPLAPTHQAVEAFIERWQNGGGRERANYQLFLTELCQLLDLPGPEPASDDPASDSYVFEHRVDIHHPDGSSTRGYIDLYRRGHFVLEAKQVIGATNPAAGTRPCCAPPPRPTPTSAPCPVNTAARPSC